MKHLIVLLSVLPFFLFAQEKVQPTLFEVENITIKPGKDKEFEAAVKAHNTKYHPQGPYFANLIYNINGPGGGTYSWVMGPTNYTAMDTRPGVGAHDEDWANNVMPFVETMGTPAYWSNDTKLSNPVNNPNHKMSLVWMYDIKRGKAAQFSELVGKVTKVYKEKRPTESFNVYWNEFADSKAGQDAAIIWQFEKWAFLDQQSNFNKDYEAVHGPGSWHNFLNHFSETVNGRTDWLRELVD